MEHGPWSGVGVAQDWTSPQTHKVTAATKREKSAADIV